MLASISAAAPSKEFPSVLLLHAVWSLEDQGAIGCRRVHKSAPLLLPDRECATVGHPASFRAPAQDPSKWIFSCLSSGTVAKMLRLVHEDLDNSQPGCRHMRLTQVAL